MPRRKKNTRTFPFLLDDKINEIRGKVMAGHATTSEMLSVFLHLDEMEQSLDDIEDQSDTFGNEGWRYHVYGDID
jgi:hypothetical protein